MHQKHLEGPPQIQVIGVVTIRRQNARGLGLAGVASTRVVPGADRLWAVFYKRL